MWILTSEHNAYDQFGAYFLGAWGTKPAVEDLLLVEELRSHQLSEIATLQLTGRLLRENGGEISYYLFEHTPNQK